MQAKAFEAAKGSLTGDRATNQDRCLFLSSGETALLCLADGLGGHPRGEVAAQLLLDATEAVFRQSEKPLTDPERFMLRCIGKAHQAILRFGRRQSPPIAPRTTAVIAVVQGGFAYWCHVGDSRLYLIRNGRVVVQTHQKDQPALVAAPVENGIEHDAGTPRADEERADPLGAVELVTRDRDQIERRAVDAQLEASFGAAPGAPLLFSHPVYQYLALRYGLNARSLHWEPDAVPSDAEWRRLAVLLAEHPAGRRFSGSHIPIGSCTMPSIAASLSQTSLPTSSQYSK